MTQSANRERFEAYKLRYMQSIGMADSDIALCMAKWSPSMWEDYRLWQAAVAPFEELVKAAQEVVDRYRLGTLKSHRSGAIEDLELELAKLVEGK